MAQSIWNEVINTFLRSRDFSGGPPLYFDIKKTSNPNYNIIQTSIESQTNKIYKKLQGLENEEISKLTETLERKKNESTYKESKLLLPKEYQQNYKNYTYKNRVKLATEVYLGLTKAKNNTIEIEEKAEIYLGYFLKSNELYNALKSSGAGELLSRTVTMGEKQTNAYIDKKVISRLSGIFGKDIQTGKIIYDELIENEIISQIQRIFQRDLENLEQNLENFTQTKLAKAYSAATRDKIRKILDQHNKENSERRIEGIIVYRDKDGIKIDITSNLELSNISRTNTILTVFASDTSKGKNSWYLAFKNNKNSNKIIFTFAQLIFKTLTNCSKFNVINVGTINLDDNMKQSMKRLLIPTKIRNFIETSHTTLDNFFNPANSNAFLSGFLGELGNYYIIKGKQNNLDLKISGSAYEEIGNGNLKSQSTADLTVGTGENAYGFNIKNYISKSNGGTITLYQSDSGLDIFNDFIYKYFTIEEVTLARYLVLNAGQSNIKSEDVKMAIGSVALKNLPKFLRITNAAGTITNLFFILNNICYPTSYIYNELIQDLQNAGRKKELKINNFFTFSQQDTELPIYEDDKDVIQDMKKDSNNNIMKQSLQDASFINKYKPNNSFYIQFKGLKVNLMSYI